MTTKAEKKPQRTRAEIREIRRAAGKKGGHAKAGHKSVINLQKELIKTHIDQRLMRATDVAIDAQIALARGTSFLYRIDKKWIPTKGSDGYYRNEPPVLVESRYEIQQYLEMLAEHNGDLSDEDDEASAYYYITTKEPNNQAIDSMLNRVHGKPKDGGLEDLAKAFSLMALAQRATQLSVPLDGNRDIVKIDLAPESLPHPMPSSDK